MNRVDDPADLPKPAERDGWFTVARAAELLGLAVPRIFDRIRDGKLQVRFEPSRPGEADRPFVTSPELKQKAADPAANNGAAAVPAGAAATAATPGTAAGSVLPPAAAPRSGVDAALLDEARRTQQRLEAELRETRETAEALETRLDTALRTIYERDVKIARLEAEAGAQTKMREEGDHFIRHLESRLDRQETRNEEKEKEIRRLAVGIGEAHSEIRLLKPPPPEPPKAWQILLKRLLLLVGVGGGALLFFWVAWQLALKSLTREAGLTAGAGVLLAFAVGWFIDRLRRTK
jgi:flagellar motility protein MotE (MotC chaperone)